MQVGFYGAAGTVTGSRFLVEAGGKRVLVDCGLFQGHKVLRQRNWKPLPFRPAELDAAVLTHAHLDHSGALPLLVRQGFEGPVYCTEATAALAAILLRDAAWIQEEDAERANRRGYSKHHPAVPLYRVEHAEAAIERLHPIREHEELALGEVKVSLHPAGHILGACGVRVAHGAHRVWFTGDLGRSHDILMRPPEIARDATWIVMESTYGDREHVGEDAIGAIADCARPALERGGIVLIPSFAVGRTQAVLLALARATEAGALPRVPTYVNSPMATDVTLLYDRYDTLHRLSADEAARIFGGASFVRTVEESRALNQRSGPMVVLSASGMLTGGRVLHHLVAWAGDPRNAIILPGFQAPGTRGAALASGASSVRVHGQVVDVRAEVHTLDALSAHADRHELTDWVAAAQPRPKRVTLVHGEPGAADALRLHLRDTLGLPVDVADAGEVVSAP